MSSNRKMTAEILSQQPGVLAVFLSGSWNIPWRPGSGEYGSDAEQWRVSAAQLFGTANGREWSNVVMHVDANRTLHLLREQDTAIVVVMETGCKFAKCVARSMRRALENATAPPKPQPQRATETQTSDDRPATSSSKGASW